MNDEEKAKPPKTKATQQAVFAYCDLLASQGFRSDFYKEIAEHFGSSPALLHKSSLRRVTPNPGRGYATAAV